MSKNTRRNANRPDGDALRANLQYVDIQKHWRKIRPFAEQSRDIWWPDMQEWRAERRISCLEHQGYLGWEDDDRTCPAHFDSCDWLLYRKGRHPQFWDYVCHSASHWVVNLNLYLAECVFPTSEWRIVTATTYSTCWDGENLVFDMHSAALRVSIDELVELAFEQSDTRILPVGEHLSIGRWSEVVQDYIDGTLTKDEVLDLWSGDDPKRCRRWWLW